MAEELKLIFKQSGKYNKLIHETNTLKKFEDIYMKLLSDEDLEMDSILGLMKIIERDVILVNELNKATALMEMTETFIKYMMMKEEEKKKEVKNPKPKKWVRDKINNNNNNKKCPKQTSEKHNSIPEEGVFECDC